MSALVDVINIDFIRRHRSRYSREKVILKDVSLQLFQGERLALLGSNGSGKTTLLRLLAGILEPTKGTINRLGRVSAMIDPGFGMSDVLSPFENCRTRLIMNRTPKGEMSQILEEVERFADIGEYFQRPMNTLSSGMWARVSFALLTSLPHEILLIDEGFGLADNNFREKASLRLGELYRGVDALVLASHDNNLLRQLCQHGIVLRNQAIAFAGPIDMAIAFHTDCVDPSQHESSSS